MEENRMPEIQTSVFTSNCPHFGACGGCAYRDLPYGEELKLKEEQVKKLLAPYLEAILQAGLYCAFSPASQIAEETALFDVTEVL